LGTTGVDSHELPVDLRQFSIFLNLTEPGCLRNSEGLTQKDGRLAQRLEHPVYTPVVGNTKSFIWRHLASLSSDFLATPCTQSCTQSSTRFELNNSETHEAPGTKKEYQGLHHSILSGIVVGRGNATGEGTMYAAGDRRLNPAKLAFVYSMGSLVCSFPFAMMRR
jgi:hypothetical protein